MKHAQIMVVEDERIVALNLRQQLVKLGYVVPDPVASGAEALRQIERSRPDVILMDVHIEGDFDGIETAALIPAGIAVIFLTAYSEECTLERARATQPYGYLVKPFSESELHATIQMSLERLDTDGLLRKHAENQALANKTLAEVAALAEQAAQTSQSEMIMRMGFEAGRAAHCLELEQQKKELERSNLALTQFAYAASHDLQSPLRAIAHLAQWIEDAVEATASAETMDHLQLLKGRTARLQMLINGLLAYARIGFAESLPEEVDVAQAVRDVVGMLELKPNFVVACAVAALPIYTYRWPLETVLKNLISNALQHHDRLEGRVCVAMRLVGDIAEIRVSDDGPGIAERFHEEIFTIFRTLQSRDEIESSGIGLALVKKQVTENGGRIWVESSSHARGTAFVFTWKPQPREGPSSRPDPAPAASQGDEPRTPELECAS